MIEKIIHTADIHIRNLRRMDEYQEQLSKFINLAKEEVGDAPEKCRIVICGDLLHSKLDISSECQLMTSWFLRELNNICKTIVICGNHDTLINNLNRVDSLTPIFAMSKFNNVIYLDKETNYASGVIEDENIVWCLYSSFEDFIRPNIEEAKINYPNKKYIGLFHGDLIGAKNDVGFSFEHGLNTDDFRGLDFVLAGHIHKRQELHKNGVKIVYAGSLIQQDFGENISSHGYVVWNVNTNTYKVTDIPNDYGFLTMEISSIDDIDNKKENLLNI